MTNEQLVELIKDGIDVSDNMLRLWEQNRGFIGKIACSYKGREEMEDLKQQGYIGLCNAVDGYRRDENVPFINYAALWIRQSMSRYIDECGSLVKLPIAKRQEQRRYKRLAREFEMHVGRPPSDREICRSMGISLKELKGIREADEKSRVDSLDRTIQSDDSDCCLGDLVPSDTNMEGDVIDKVQQEQLKVVIWAAVDALPEKESQIMYFRYKDGMTSREIGNRIGVSPQRVNQIEHKALRYMERIRRKNGLADFMPDGLYRHNGVAEFNRTWTSSTELAALKIHEKESRPVLN